MTQSAEKHAGLSRARISVAALTVLAQVGLEGITLRKVAAELGVRHGALYWHVRDKQDLLDEVAEAILAGEFAAMPELSGGQDWRSWMLTQAQRLRRAMLSHRDGAAIIATCQARTRVATFAALREAMVSGLRAAGFSVLDAFDIQLAIIAYTLGLAIQEQSTGEALLGKGESRFPRLKADRLSQPQSPATGDAQFAAGIGLLLSGAASLRQRR